MSKETKEERRRRLNREYARRKRAEIKARMESDPVFADEWRKKKSESDAQYRESVRQRLVEDPEFREKYRAQKRAHTAARRQRQRARMEADPEYRDAVKRQKSEQDRLSYQKNREKRRAYQREYSRKNASAARSRARAWREANRDSEEFKKQRFRDSRRRRARQLGQVPSGSSIEAELVIEGTGARVRRREIEHRELADRWTDILRHDPCSYQRWAAKTEHVDHIVPVSKGGLDAWDNLTAASAKANQIKSARSMLEFLLIVLANDTAPAYSLQKGQNDRSKPVDPLNHAACRYPEEAA